MFQALSPTFPAAEAAEEASSFQAGLLGAEAVTGAKPEPGMSLAYSTEKGRSAQAFQKRDSVSSGVRIGVEEEEEDLLLLRLEEEEEEEEMNFLRWERSKCLALDSNWGRV